MRVLPRLYEDLRMEGARIDLLDSGAGVTLHEYGGHALVPPVTVALSEADLKAYLDRLTDARHVFPEVDDAEARYRLFLVHLDELLQTRPDDATRLQLRGGYLSWAPRR